MHIVFSLAKVSEDLYWTRYSDSLNPLEVRNLCKKIFGDDINTQNSPIATLELRMGKLSFAPSGTDGVVALYNDTMLKTAKDFQVCMRPMPLKTPIGSGDFYLAIKRTGSQKPSFLVWNKASNQLVYFPNPQAMQDYYDTLGVSPHLVGMSTAPSRYSVGG